MALLLYNGVEGPNCLVYSFKEMVVMAKAKEWRESSSGPDCLDCAVIMGAIQALHSGHVALIVSPSGTGSPTSVDLALSIIFDLLPGSSLPANVAVHQEWPNKWGRTMWGEVYNLCWMLDAEISKVYNQEVLWK